jgi:Domain of unknown function (DUF309)
VNELEAHLVMPRRAYLPGESGEPDRAPLEKAKALLPARFDHFVPADDAAFRYGLALHDNGFFWEAHEVWEAVWKAAPMNGRDRIALRALIQFANAGLKRRMGRAPAVRRLLDEVAAALTELIARGQAPQLESVAGRLGAAALLSDVARSAAGEWPRLASYFNGKDAEKCIFAVSQALDRSRNMHYCA